MTRPGKGRGLALEQDRHPGGLGPTSWCLGVTSCSYQRQGLEEWLMVGLGQIGQGPYHLGDLPNTRPTR